MLISPLAPSTQSANPKSAGRFPFAFGTRFFIALLIGLVWTIPAWWAPRFIGVMFLWDAAVLAAWLTDYLRLPLPSQLNARRIWSAPLSLAQPGAASVEVENAGRIPIHVSLIDELPAALRDPPPSLEIDVPAGGSTRREYNVMPRKRGDNAAGRLFLRYRSPLGLAERWATADLSQSVRVLPDLAQARNYALYLIRSRQVEMEKRRRRQRGQGRDFESLREYRQGDDHARRLLDRHRSPQPTHHTRLPSRAKPDRMDCARRGQAVAHGGAGAGQFRQLNRSWTMRSMPLCRWRRWRRNRETAWACWHTAARSSN